MGTQIEEFLLSVICLAITNYAGRAKSFRKKPNRTDGPLINEIYEFCKQKMRSSYDNIEFEADATGENDHSQNDKNNKIKIAGLFSQTIMLLNKVNNHRFLTQLKAFLRQKAEKLSHFFHENKINSEAASNLGHFFSATFIICSFKINSLYKLWLLQDSRRIELCKD